MPVVKPRRVLARVHARAKITVYDHLEALKSRCHLRRSAVTSDLRVFGVGEADTVTRKVWRGVGRVDLDRRGGVHRRH